MDNPRASKRRKVGDAPRNPASSPQTDGTASPATPLNGTLKRPSRQNNLNQPSPFLSTRKSTRSVTTPNLLPKKQLQTDRLSPELFDDIDGALEKESPSKKRFEDKLEAPVQIPTITVGEEPVVDIPTNEEELKELEELAELEREQEAPAPVVPAKRGRGRPRKNPLPEDLAESASKQASRLASLASGKLIAPNLNGTSPLRSSRARGRPKLTPGSPLKRTMSAPIGLRDLAASQEIVDTVMADGDNGMTDAVPYVLETVHEAEPVDDGEELSLLKKIVMEKLIGKRAVPLTGLDDEFKKVRHLVEQTVTVGEGNSMLLIGARGSGKTALMRKVLREVSRDHREDFHIVQLSGFIHTDDKLALREIWRQLGREMQVEDDNLGKNYADTLATLLALLSHPSELGEGESDQISKAVIFVIDEFDLFAAHPRQTLLYNLFDIAQSRKAPIAVLGLTTRIDVSDSLEKRVKSRFSHRYVHLSLPKSFTSFQEICKCALQLQPNELSLEERALLSRPLRVLPTADESSKTDEGPATLPNYLSCWNTSIETLFSTQSFLQTHLSHPFHITKSIPTTLSSFLPTLSTLTYPRLPLHRLPPPQSLSQPDSLLDTLPALSTLSLSLLIATARLDILLDTDTCNFNLAYAEYVDIVSKARIANAAAGQGFKVWGKEVARREWEALLRVGLLLPAGNLGGGSGASAGMMMVRCDVSLEEIGVALLGTDRVLEKWCRQL